MAWLEAVTIDDEGGGTTSPPSPRHVYSQLILILNETPELTETEFGAIVIRIIMYWVIWLLILWVALLK